MAPAILPCLVPFCPRSRNQRGKRESFGEWICADHWRAVPIMLRRAHRRAARNGETAKAQTWWGFIRRDAIERAFGLR